MEPDPPAQGMSPLLGRLFQQPADAFAQRPIAFAPQGLPFSHSRFSFFHPAPSPESPARPDPAGVPQPSYS
jgi:hypothetical protein